MENDDDDDPQMPEIKDKWIFPNSNANLFQFPYWNFIVSEPWPEVLTDVTKAAAGRSVEDQSNSATSQTTLVITHFVFSSIQGFQSEIVNAREERDFRLTMQWWNRHENRDFMRGDVNMRRALSLQRIPATASMAL